MQYNSNLDQTLSKPPIELLNWLLNEFSIEIPEVIATPQDMENASQILLHLSGAYSYLMALLSYAKLKTREAKRNLSKEEYEDMVDRRDVIDNVKDIVKQNYAAVSRAVTICIENNNELKMGRGTP